jgi:methionyl-tRNA formyltransferase
VNILLVGEESAGIQTLKALAGGDHRIVAVMASQSKNNGGLANLWETSERLEYQREGMWILRKSLNPEVALSGTDFSLSHYIPSVFVKQAHALNARPAEMIPGESEEQAFQTERL